MKPGIKCLVGIRCVDGNDNTLYDGGDDMHLVIPPWAMGDKQMEAIHLESNARQQLVVLFRRLMLDDPNYLPQEFKDAYAKNDWQVNVRVIPYPDTPR
jgi:hypothetical protein